MKSHPILEAIAVFVSLAASASISVDNPDDKPVATTTVTKETVHPQPPANPGVTTTETTTTRSR